MNDSLDLRWPDQLHDDVALDEIELYAEVLIAVADADRPLSPTEIDRVLGLPGIRAAPAGSGEAHRSATEHAADGCDTVPGTEDDRAREREPFPHAPVPAPEEPGDRELGRRLAWSADPLPAGHRLPPTVLPAPRDVPEPHALWAPLPLSPWYV